MLLKRNSIKHILSIVLCLIIALVFTSCRHNSIETPSSTETENNNMTVSKDSSTDNTTTETEDTSTSISSKEDDKTSSKPTSEKEPDKNTSKDESSSSPSSSSNSSEDNNSSDKTSSKPKPVQPANPETGISWDGKSPIIYTYTDGTTGTEKRDGAKYEYLPGKWRTINFPKDSAGRLVGSICKYCGKTVAKEPGNPNTCTRYTYTHYCSLCGKHVKYSTCHSCSKSESFFYCHECGKISGNGTNGTCLRYWAGGEHECPNCSATIPAGRCHTCE